MRHGLPLILAMALLGSAPARGQNESAETAPPAVAEQAEAGATAGDEASGSDSDGQAGENAAAGAQRPPAPPPRVEPVIAAARAAVLNRDTTEAARVLNVLREANPPLSEAERTIVDAELLRVHTVARQRIQIAAANAMIDRGEVAEARTLLLETLSSAEHPMVLEEARRALKRDANFFFQLWRGFWDIVTGLLPGVLLLGLVGGGLFWLRSILKERGREAAEKVWLLTDLDDRSERSIKSLIARDFYRWSHQEPDSTMSGLLLMEASSIPLSPQFSLTTEQVSFAKELSEVELSVRGISIASLAKAVDAFAEWFRAQPNRITGTVYIDDDKRICARLNAVLPERKENDKIASRSGVAQVISVSATAASGAEESVRRVAEEVAFKMLYALATKDADGADQANSLRDGLDDLRAYLSGGDAAARAPANRDDPVPAVSVKLESARLKFETVRKARPDMLEAHMYEGIALDLLERHDDAIAHFDHVSELTKDLKDKDKDKTLYQQALYNAAVASLRSLYSFEAITAAIERFDGLIGADTSTNTLLERPLLALAVATKADAYANRTIHWKGVPSSEVPYDETTPDSVRVAAVVKHHDTIVTGLLKKVEDALKIEKERAAGVEKPEVKSKAWDDETRRQIEWAINNAYGDLYLYGAVHCKRNGAAVPDGYVTKAEKAFRTCEMLLPAGVETLSNLGTLYSLNSKYPKARLYFDRAIKLNPNYEYAYYKLAETWEKQQHREKVIETLRAFPNPPQIPSFEEMFPRYYVEPKHVYP